MSGSSAQDNRIESHEQGLGPLAGAVETEIRTDLVPGLGEVIWCLSMPGFAIERLLLKRVRSLKDCGKR